LKYRLVCSLIIHDFQDIQEYIDNIQIKGNCGQNIAIFLILISLIISTHNHLCIKKQIKTKKNDANHGPHKAHMEAKYTKEECTCTEHKADDREEGSANCEILGCCGGVECYRYYH